MSPVDQLKRRIQERTIRAIHLIEECEAMVEPETKSGQHSYLLDRKMALEMYLDISETIVCLKRLLVKL